MSIKGCILPWVHIYGDLEGDYRPCCFSDSRYSDSLGNKDTSLMDVWHSDAYIKIRQQFLNEEIPLQCKKACYDKEALGVEQSPRQNANNKWSKYENLQTNLLPPPPIFIDFRFSNLCNFRCRSCGPGQSTSWITESKKLFNKLNAKKIDNWTDNDNLWDALEFIYPTLDTIYFAGGEPLILDGHYKMLEFLIAKGKTDITINYNTNLSMLKYKQYDLESLWSNFKKVNLWVSCDGYGTTAEYIRKELNWEEFNANIDIVKDKVSTISSVISLLSIYSMPDLLLWSMSKNIAIFGTTLIGPRYLSCQILPDTEKDKIIAYYKTFIEANKDKLSKQQIYNIFDWLRFLKGTIDNREQLEREFKRITIILDNSRGESFSKTVPQLAEWYESIKVS